jgi:hypothetical protein
MFLGRIKTAARNIPQTVNQLTEYNICLILFIAALTLRLIGIKYGYWHGDERVNEAAKVLTGQLVPDQHFYPPLFNYLVALAYAGMYAIGRVIPFWHDASEFRALYFTDPTVFYISARFITAIMSAFIAPLFYLIARELNLGRWPSLLTAALAIFLPVSVLLAHVAKSDVPLATMTIAVLYCLLLKYRNPRSLGLDAALGLAVSLAFSFKQSFLFPAIPLAAWHIYWLSSTLTRVELLRSLAVSFIVCVGSWIILNIGIILDLEDFLAYQKIQAKMSVRSSPFFGGALVWADLATDAAKGVTLISVLLFFAFPIFLTTRLWRSTAKLPLGCFWAAVVVASLIVIATTGERQHEGLWLPYFTAMQLFVGLLLAMLVNSSNRALRFSGIGLFILALLSSTSGVFKVLDQALAKPITDDVAQFVRENYSERKIVTSFDIRIPQRKEAQELEFARAQRLAEKYKIELPPRSNENIVKYSREDSIFHVFLPTTMFGLEHATDETLDGTVKPYAWPLQEEEWKLDHWLGSGFDIFIIRGFEYWRDQQNAPLIRNFFIEMEHRCALTRHYQSRKDLYLESRVAIFDCARGP